jgi:predicted dehydrogenase
MVEKPLAIREEELLEYERLQLEFPNQPIQVGYVMPRTPHIVVCLEQLKAGRYGRVVRFAGFALISLIQISKPKRWEVQKEKSGGGVLINSGGHVLSMIQAAFGDPQSVGAQAVKLFSTEVEDTMVIHFAYPEFSGIQYCSWSIDGFSRQENKLVVWTDRGRLILMASMGVFVPHQGEMEVIHQLDADVGYNMAPDFGGSGFTTELLDLKKATLTRQPAPMNVKRAVQLERLLFKIYDGTREVRTLAASNPDRLDVDRLQHDQDTQIPSGTTSDARRILDLRDLSADAARSYLAQAAETPATVWRGYLLTPDQMRGLPRHHLSQLALGVTAPDFLSQSRLLATGRYVQVLKQMGLRGIVNAGVAALPSVAKGKGATFWVAAVGLLAASLRSIPAGFDGNILIHTYLADIALSLRRLDMLDRLVGMCRRAHPKARVGFHTNLASEALNALWMLETSVDVVSVLTSPHALHMDAMVRGMREAAQNREITVIAEVGLAPDVVHRAAFKAPQTWTFGADGILLGLAAEPSLADRRRVELAKSWGDAFPGLSLPEEAV